MTDNSSKGNNCSYSIKKKVNYSTKEDLLHLEKQELVDMVLRLQAHNENLRNILAKRKDVCLENEEEAVLKNCNSSTHCGKGKKRSFDFTKCGKRHVFLKFLYFGWDYQGVVTQENTPDTVEEHIFNALIKTCLIESRETSNFHRCGRTDKGVSASGQIISIDVRSKFHDPDSDDDSELPYCKMLNRLLPEDIRVVSWCPVPSYCSARFNCTSRSYRYYFIKGDLNIKAMSEAASYLIGEHDFRNLCKMDVGNGVVSFTRNIQSASVSTFSTSDGHENGEFDVCVFKITANGFLWRQIRCIMTILLLVGEGKETPSIIKELMDLNKYPRKPQYQVSHCVPLALHDCQYDFEPEWKVDIEELKLVLLQLQKNWSLHQIKSSQILDMINDVIKESGVNELPNFQSSGLIPGVHPRVYKPLSEGPFCETLESKIEHFVKKQRIQLKENPQKNDSDDDSCN